MKGWCRIKLDRPSRHVYIFYNTHKHSKTFDKKLHRWITYDTRRLTLGRTLSTWSRIGHLVVVTMATATTMRALALGYRTLNESGQLTDGQLVGIWSGNNTTEPPDMPSEFANMMGIWITGLCCVLGLIGESHVTYMTPRGMWPRVVGSGWYD